MYIVTNQQQVSSADSFINEPAPYVLNATDAKDSTDALQLIFFCQDESIVIPISMYTIS